MKSSIYNIIFRGLTLASKFLFILFIGKYSIDESNLGIFGMISTSVALLIYVIGFDFYVFNTREILKTQANRIDKIKNQLFFHLIVYLIIVPISFFVIFKFGFISIEYIWLLLVLLISEHLGQELYRLFTTLEKSILANIMLFFRSGLWVWFALVDYFVLNNPIDIKRYIIFWTLFSWVSFVVFGVLLVRFIGIKTVKYSPPDWKWINEGMKMASVFFIGSLSFQVIQFSDRFMIDYFYDKKLVGVYTAYAQFTNAIDVFTFSAITMVAYPKLVKAFTDNKKYDEIKNKFSKHLFLFSISLILIVCFVGPVIFKYLDKPAIFSEINTFYTLLGGMLFLILSNIYHYDLYVKKKDGVILKTAFIGMIINVGLNIVLIPRWSIFGAATATLFSFFTIFILKLYYSKITNNSR
jgi:O-antigen/teichoic acid export membrane protein